MADEEALGSFCWPTGDESALNHMAGFYLDNFGIEFHYHWWYSWDSSDPETDTYYLLYEAIDEMGWYWGKVVDDEPMELMIVISGQVSPYEGLSLPWERAFILGLGSGNIYRHEMGHQFGCEH